MPSCISCGLFVTSHYSRVFGDNDGRVTDCPNCPDREGGY
jgi:hypothetical protein